MPRTPSCVSALKRGSGELGCPPIGMLFWSCFLLWAQVSACLLERAGMGPSLSPGTILSIHGVQEACLIRVWKRVASGRPPTCWKFFAP